MEEAKHLTIHVMLPTGSRITYILPSQTTAGDLIKKLGVDPQVTIPENKTISIIYRGKILKPSDVLSSFDELTEFSVQIFFRQMTKETEEIKIRTLTGFDRLIRMNYTPEQIQEYRDSFHSIHNSSDLPESARLDMEEEWFPIIFNTDNPGDIIALANQNHSRRSTSYRRNLPHHPTPSSLPPPPPTHHHVEAHSDDHDELMESPLLQQETENNDNNETQNTDQDGNDDILDDDNSVHFSPIVEFTLGVVLGLVLGVFSVAVMGVNFRLKYLTAGAIVGLTLNISLGSGI